MAEVTDPAAIRFANERIRPACNQIVGSALTAEVIGAEWTDQGVAAKFPNSPREVMDGERVDDGDGNMVPKDGRTAILSQDVNVVMEFISQFGALLDQNSVAQPSLTYRQVINKVHVRPST